jgi:phasin family protein
MATNATSKIDAAAEKAYAEAAAQTTSKPATSKPATKAAPAKKAPAKAAVAKKGAPAKKAPVKKPVAKKPVAKKAAPKKAAVKKAPVRKAAAKKAPATKVAAKKAAPKKTAAKKTAAKTTTAAKPAKTIKETIMAKAEKTDITGSAKEMAADVQERVKTAAAKTAEFAGDLNEFNKGNLEAVVESGKILFAGAQEMGREQLATGKSVVETVTEDAKKMAGVKSPTELVQLQGELARRNLDAAISYGSKRTEAWLKLTGEAFAPIQGRVSVATEKFSKAA